MQSLFKYPLSFDSEYFMHYFLMQTWLLLGVGTRRTPTESVCGTLHVWWLRASPLLFLPDHLISSKGTRKKKKDIPSLCGSTSENVEYLFCKNEYRRCSLYDQNSSRINVTIAWYSAVCEVSVSMSFKPHSRQASLTYFSLLQMSALRSEKKRQWKKIWANFWWKFYSS